MRGTPWRRLVRGPAGDPAWVRLALLGLLVGTGILYLWGLRANGNGNTFYAAAVQAGTKSWRAFFFGSFDSSSFITVDKPPASLWVMALSGRIFGFNSWSMLVPQALEGVAAVSLLYAAVRRWYGSGTGLLAGAALALSPVAAQMFRYNNPDALLTLLLVAAAYATVRAIEGARGWWLALAGLLIGFGFLTKMLEALLVVPALALAYLVAAPVSFWRRVRDLAVAGAVLVVGAGWWVAAVALTPAADRPFVGGSTNNSVLQLAFGYNGLSRITGNRRGGGGGAPAALRDVQAQARRFAGFGFGGQRGLTRMFSGSWATDAAWLIPAALIAFVVGLWLTRRATRTDLRRAGLLLFGGWMLVSALVFSYASGIVHEYYSVAMAPAVGALAAIGTTMFWSRRDSWVGRAGLSAMVAATGLWAFVLLDRTPHWNPWLRFLVAAVALAGVAGILGGSLTRRRLALPVGSLALAATLLGPAAYSAEAAFASHGGGGAFLAAGPVGTQGRLPAAFEREAAQFAERNGFAFAFGGNVRPAGGRGNGGFGRGTGGFMGGRDGAQTPSSAVVSRLEAGASQYRWVAAATSAPQAAPFELATGKPVMAIGGFMGSDNAITLQAFQQLVRQGKVHYFIGGGFGPGAGPSGPGAAPGAGPAGNGGGGPGFGGFRGGTSSDAGQIATWVTQHYQPETVGGTTLYDLTAH